MGRIPIVFLLRMLAGCSSMLTTALPPPVDYQLDYPAVAVACAQGFSAGVRVLDFSTAAPFDRPEMVVVRPGGEVRFSGDFQWVEAPGRMLSEALERDLSAGTEFPLVFGADAPVAVPLELTGRVFRFAWERRGKNSQGVLKVEVSLLEAGPPLRVLFHRVYELRSPLRARSDSSLFAAGMSALAGRFSLELRRDLCAAASRDRKRHTRRRRNRRRRRPGSRPRHHRGRWSSQPAPNSANGPSGIPSGPV